MTQNEALKLRTILDALFTFEKHGLYGVAIKEPIESDPADSFEVHIFVRDDNKSGHLALALLAHVIELFSYDFLAAESHYDLGTIKGEHVVPSWRIW